MKLLGGSLANDETRRVRLASGGYVVTAVATSAIGLTTAVWQAGALRAELGLERTAHSADTEVLQRTESSGLLCRVRPFDPARGTEAGLLPETGRAAARVERRLVSGARVRCAIR